ncbi:thioester-forming surface-anchored protein, partial [Helcococcus kunzii]
MRKKITLLFLALVLIITSHAPLSVAASLSNSNGTENTDNHPYIGYQEGSTGLTNKLYVEKKGDPSVRRIVYCFNKELHWPDTKGTLGDLAYEKTTGSVDHFKDEVHTNSKYKGQELIDKLKIVLLNGYPNANKIQNALNLTNDQMQKVTQMAVWHFTDNLYTRLGHFQSVSELEALALATLIEMAKPIANGESTLGADVLNHFENEHKKTHPDYVRPESVEMPENSTLDLYIQNGVKQEDGKGYQNLLGAFLINSDTKEIIEIPKDEKPVERKKLTLTKYNSNYQQLEGAEFEISKVDEPNKVITTVKSSSNGPVEFELEAGSYILNETVSPKGYQKLTEVKFTVENNGRITIDDYGKYEDNSKPDSFELSTMSNNFYITDKEKPEQPEEPGHPEEPTPTNTKVIIRKYAKGDYKKLLEGAELELYKISDDEKEGTLVGGSSFISDNKGKEFELTDGFYILKEKKAPKGYKLADDINFEVKNRKVLIDGKEAPKGISNPFSYEAYSDFNNDGEMIANNPYGKFYYVKKEGQNQVVYCFNATKHAPAESYDDGDSITYEPQYGEIKYNKIINSEELYKYAQNPRIASAELATKVTRIIHAGYPNNKAGIQNIGLTNTQLRAATQLAIYYYTDSADLTDEGLEKLGDGFQLLKGNGETESKIKDYAKTLINYSNSDQAPSDLSYDFYVANNGHYQNLIGTAYDSSDLHYVISMEDEEDKVKETKVSFSKTDILGEELKGATLQIKDKSNNEVIKEWTSGDKPETFNFKPGKYEFVETAAPKGYKIATSIDFEITTDGKVVANKDSLKTEGSENIITMVDDYETIDKLVIKKVWKGKPVDDLPIYFRLHKGVEGGDSSIEDPTVPSNSLNGNQNPIKYENKDIVIEGLSLPTINQYGNKVKYSLTEVTLKDNLYTKWEKAGYETVVESKIEGNTLTFTVTNKE